MKLCISPSTQQHNVGVNGYVEETEMNKVADILCPELIRHGIQIMRIPKTMDSVNAIVSASNAYNPDYHIAIHSNAGGGTGCEIWCSNPTNPLHKGTQMAKAIYKYLAPITPTVTDRGLKDENGNIGEVGRTTAPAVLMEVEFHDNPIGANWIMANTNNIAQAILKGILEQCKIAYIPKVPALDPKDAQIALQKKQIDELTKENATLKSELQSTKVLNVALTANNTTYKAKLQQIHTLSAV